MRTTMLVLHGFTMNGAIMRTGPAELWAALAPRVDLQFPDGALDCTPATVERLYARMGTPPLPPPHHAWWNASDDGRIYYGWDQSLARIAGLLAAHGRETPCAILGFSQGAIAAGALAALSLSGAIPPLAFVVLVAGSIPRSEMLAPLFRTPIRVPSLHVWGTSDPMGVMAPLLVERFDPAMREVVTWPGEHRVPARGPGAEAIVDFVNRKSVAS